MITIELTPYEAISLLNKLQKPNPIDEWKQPIPGIRKRITEALKNQ